MKNPIDLIKFPVSCIDVSRIVAYTCAVSDSNNMPTESDQPASAQSPSQQGKQGSNLTILLLFLAIAVLIGYIFGNSFQQKSDSSSTSLAAKQAELDATLAATNQKREQMGLPPLLGYGAEDGEKIAARLTKDAVSLAAYVESFRSQLLEKERLLERRNEELIASEQTRTALTSQIAKMQMKVDSVSSASAATADLQERLALAESQVVELRNQLAQPSAVASSDELSAANAKILDLEKQLASLLSISDVPISSNSTGHQLLANAETDLLPQAQTFFQSLAQLEDKTGAEINQAFNRITQQHKASYICTIQFDADSSALKSSEQTALTEGLSKIPDGALILVIGYSSTTGDPSQNRTLSSNRAHECAKLAMEKKLANQRVQAIYYGQTKRFSPSKPEQNQVCQIFAIMP
jgi:outer membrane protein OmpA-like peptidoglycan-associated protein